LADLPTEVGVYSFQGAWVQIMPEIINWKTGGVLKHLFTAGIVKGDVNGHLTQHSNINGIATPTLLFVCTPEGTEITEYELLRLRTHSNSREFRSVTGGVFHKSGGATRDTKDFEFKELSPRNYLIDVAGLKAGEYGLLPPGAMMDRHASAQYGKVYTFTVRG